MDPALNLVGRGWVGPAYRGAVPLLWMLAPGGIFLACGQVVGDILRGLGRPGQVALAQGLTAVCAGDLPNRPLHALERQTRPLGRGLVPRRRGPSPRLVATVLRSRATLAFGW